MAILFTADLHLGHVNILKFCARPFDSISDMEYAIISNWNAVVTPEDEVWVLGDFAYRNQTPAAAYLSKLNGTKHLVTGNHDSIDTVRAKGWASVQPFAEITVDNHPVTMCHYAMRLWPRMKKGGVNLFGHSHGRLPGYQTNKGGGQLDVGVDCWGFRPVSMTDIQRRLRTLPQMPGADHHYEGAD